MNIIGQYEGTRPLDFLDEQQTVRFQIESSGQWGIEVLPLLQGRKAEVPGTLEGKGDDVVFLAGETPDLLKIDATTAQSNFVVWGYGNRRDLLVNEIAPYDGVVVAGGNTIVLVIEAEGNWSIEITSK